jgi:hypothetical protein
MRVTIRTADWNSDSDRPHLAASADLVYESAPDFYNCFSLSRDELRENLIRQLRDENSVLGYSILATFDDSFGGIAVYFPSEEAKTRRLVSTRYLMQMQTLKPDAPERLRALTAGVEAISVPRYMYLARIGVAPESRRLGVAGMLHAVLECECKSRQIEYICSHVDRDSTPTVKMHLARGFARISAEDHQFVVMAKHLR